MDNIITFSKEWFPIEKEQFRVLALLADHKGEYSGNLSDMCRYFNLTLQTSNRNRIKEAIVRLAESGYITYVKKGNTYLLHLCTISEEDRLNIPQEWYKEIKDHTFSRSVAWEQVVKVYLWLQENEGMFTNAEIAARLNVSADVITNATLVLQNDFSAIFKKVVKEKIRDCWCTFGQQATITAWWTKT